ARRATRYKPSWTTIEPRYQTIPRDYSKSRLSHETPENSPQKDLPMPSFRFLAFRFFAFRLLAPALFAFALCGAPLSASAESFSDTQRGDIETIVRNYLIAHPEVLEE